MQYVLFCFVLFSIKRAEEPKSKWGKQWNHREKKKKKGKKTAISGGSLEEMWKLWPRYGEPNPLTSWLLDSEKYK